MQKHCIHLEYNEKITGLPQEIDIFTCLQVNKQNKPKEISVLHVRERV